MDYDFLKSVIAVPYLPLLGVIDPECADQQLLNDLLSHDKSGKMLPYDKNNRWYTSNPERIISYKTGTDWAAFVTERHTETRIYWYAHRRIRPSDIRFLTNKRHPKIITFAITAPTQPHSHVAAAFIGVITPQQAELPVYLDSLPLRIHRTLKELATDEDNSGFAFLAEQYSQGKNPGPTLVYIDNNQIVGAIGPLTILPDNHHTKRLLPAYFGVHTAYRSRGIGSLLWRQSYDWAHEHGAQYITLQAEQGAAAERFYERHGLQKIGYIMQA